MKMKKVLALALAIMMLAVLPATSAAAAPARDSLVVITSAEPTHFDMVGDTSSQNDVIVLNNIYDSLITIDADSQYHPSLAESWEMAEDGLSYTFKLRQDVTFHNGYKFTAEDVKFTLEGINARNNGSSLFANFTEAEVIDDYTVRLNLSAPYAAFLTGLASRDGFIQSKQLYEEIGHEGYQENPVGTGPYKFVSRKSGASVTLAANENYWGGEPEIKNVTIQVISEAATQMITLEAHEADVLLQPALTTVLNLTGDTVTWDYTPSAARTTIDFNCNDSSLASDINFRKAVQCAINKEDVLLGAMEGYGAIIDIDMSLSYTGRPTDNAPAPAYDPEAAKEYLTAAGYNGEEFKLIVTAGTTAELAANVIQNQLSEVGINCAVGAYDATTYFNCIYSGADYDARIRSNQSSVMDAEALFSTFRKDSTILNSYSRIDELDSLLRQGRMMANGPERIAVYTQAVDIITEEAYQVPLYSDINIIAFDSSLQGVAAHPLNFYRFADWSWG